MPNPALAKSRSKVSNSAFTRDASASRSVNDRASLEITRALFQSSFFADSRPSFERPVTRTRAPPSRSILAVASPIPLVPPMITTFLPWYRSMCILLEMLGLFVVYELFSTIMGVRKTTDFSMSYAGRFCYRRNRRRRGFDRLEIDARDLDDGLPRGILAGAIVEVWLALHLNWA